MSTSGRDASVRSGSGALLRDDRLRSATFIMETPGADEGWDAVNMRRALLLWSGSTDLPELPRRRSGRPRRSTRVVRGDPEPACAGVRTGARPLVTLMHRFLPEPRPRCGLFTLVVTGEREVCRAAALVRTGDYAGNQTQHDAGLWRDSRHQRDQFSGIRTTLRASSGAIGEPHAAESVSRSGSSRSVGAVPASGRGPSAPRADADVRLHELTHVGLGQNLVAAERVLDARRRQHGA